MDEHAPEPSVEIPNLREALAAAQAALDAARAEGNGDAEADRAAEIGDLLYRLGDARGAFEALALALELGAGDACADDDLGLEVQAALAARRAALNEEAMAGLRRALEHPLAEAPASRAVLLAELALCAAAMGDAVTADDRLQEADRLAKDSELDEAVVRVWRTIGEASLLLERPRDASTAFVRALEVAQDAASATGVSPSVAPAEIFATLVGLHAAGGAGDEILLGALALAPEALREGDAWWELPRLSAGLVRLATAGYLGEPTLFAPARLVAGLAIQRDDCAAHHGGLRIIAG